MWFGVKCIYWCKRCWFECNGNGVEVVIICLFFIYSILMVFLLLGGKGGCVGSRKVWYYVWGIFIRYCEYGGNSEVV